MASDPKPVLTPEQVADFWQRRTSMATERYYAICYLPGRHIAWPGYFPTREAAEARRQRMSIRDRVHVVECPEEASHD